MVLSFIWEGPSESVILASSTFAQVLLSRPTWLGTKVDGDSDLGGTFGITEPSLLSAEGN
jgi:hypothetical protein